MTLRPAMQRFLDYFAALGPRWGLAADTCRAHAALYLCGRPATADEVADLLALERAQAKAALEDLASWGMARQTADGRWTAGGEPWDLLFAGLEERRRREIGPALEAMRACSSEAAGDRGTDAGVRLRIDRMLRLVEDLAALDAQAGRLGPAGMARMVSLGGSAARLLDRFLPRLRDRSRR